ncbi:sensor histidine kinase [Clostridium sp. D2Q-14]|nr:sensor histidine kinase [Anaeromonas gelatinilytica]
MIGTKELIEGSKKHTEYLALQNQINPHFLYNTLEAIRSEALINVNNRIKLILGYEYGIYMYSKLRAGTDVEITIPLVLDNLKTDKC